LGKEPSWPAADSAFNKLLSYVRDRS